MKVNIYKKLFFIAAALFLTAICAAEHQYPPNNAGILYYKAYMQYQPDVEIRAMISDYLTGKTELNEQIIGHLKENQRIIQTITTAADIPDCDWALNYSEGSIMEMPSLTPARLITKLLAADALLLAEQKDYKQALQRCMTIKKMSCHIDGYLIISYLVSIAMNTTANDIIQKILSCDIDTETLEQFKKQMAEQETKKPSVKKAYINDFEFSSPNKKEELKEFKIAIGVPEGVNIPIEERKKYEYERRKLREIIENDELFNKCIEYWKRHIYSLAEAFDMHYQDGFNRIKVLEEKLQKEAKEKPETFLAVNFNLVPGKIFVLSIRNQSQDNAIRTAIEIYIDYAKKGRLTEKISENWPKDPYSNKPFKYEKTNDGFILRCNTEDYDKKKIYEYEFKLKRETKGALLPGNDKKQEAAYDFTKDPNLPPRLIERIQLAVEAMETGDARKYLSNYNIDALYKLVKGEIKFEDNHPWFSRMGETNVKNLIKTFGQAKSQGQMEQMMIEEATFEKSGKIYVKSVTLEPDGKHAKAVCVSQDFQHRPTWTYFDGDWWQTDD